jgi:hypothetical protein
LTQPKKEKREMSVININRDDLNKYKPIEPGWYGATLKEADSVGKPSRKGDSLNYKTTFLIDETGVEVDNTFNDKGGFVIVPFVCAIMGCTEDDLFGSDSNVGLEPETIFTGNVGKSCDILIVNVEGEKGGIFNNIDDFAPLGTNSETAKQQRAAARAANKSTGEAPY